MFTMRPARPLAIIAGRAQLLMTEETDPERRRELAVVNAQEEWLEKNTFYCEAIISVGRV